MIGDVHETLLCGLLVPNIDPEYILEAVALINDRFVSKYRWDSVPSSHSLYQMQAKLAFPKASKSCYCDPQLLLDFSMPVVDRGG